MQPLTTATHTIKLLAEEREDENSVFRSFLKTKESSTIDRIVHRLNDEIAPQIDCTQCGNCCRHLMINVTEPESKKLSVQLKMDEAAFREKYIEQSPGGKMVISKIPCHFLEGNKCSIYENRFEGCREFPHLDRENFTDRLFGILMYYGTCPIIFNVVEELKEKTGFAGKEMADG